MGSVLHGSARTTPRIRAELQASQESTRSLAVCYRLNPKTVAKWRKRPTTADAQMGPKAPKSTVLTPAEEAMAVAFRQKTLLPLDDVLGCLKDTIPNLSRSALHRCLQRHGISRLPVEGTKTQRKRFKTYEIGYVHIDSCELRHADGRLVMFLAIDRVSKFTYVEFRDSAGKMEGAAFLRNVAEAFPCQIHTVLTDNGMAFADLPKNRDGPSRRFLGPHIFDRVCREHGIEHRLTKPYHPWTNGQAERMNRTVKDATIKAFHYDNIDSLKAHVLAFVAAYNFAKHLKALRWKTPYRVICDAWTKDPSIFKINPNHLIPGPHNSAEAIEGWKAACRTTPGGQRRFSSLAIETVLVLGALHRMPLRQMAGFVRSLVEPMRLDLTVPDHSTLSRRRRTVVVTEFRWPRKGSVDIVIDSTGLKFFGAGEWARAKHGESRRSWRKLHLSVNPDDNEILAFELTDDDTSDVAMIGELVAASGSNIACVIADGAYDGAPSYEAIRKARPARSPPKIVIPPKAPSLPDKGELHGGSERECHAAEIARHGRIAWQNRHGYGKRSLAETAISRIKRINDGRLTSRTFGAQQNEVAIHIKIANRQMLIARSLSERLR